MTVGRLAAYAAALGFTLYAVLDLANRAHGAPRTLVLIASIACVVVVRLAGADRLHGGQQPQDPQQGR